MNEKVARIVWKSSCTQKLNVVMGCVGDIFNNILFVQMSVTVDDLLKK